MDLSFIKQFAVVCSILSLALLSPAISAVSADSQSPGEMVVSTIDTGLKILKDPEYQAPDKMDERRSKLWEILEPVFNVDEIARRVLGRHWSDRTAEEKENFKNAFTEILKDSYLGRTDSYQGERIEFIREIVKGGRGKVQTHFYTVDGKKYIVDFSLTNKSGRWQIYDATVEGVSVVSTYRSQFYEIIQRSSFDALMEQLYNKTGYQPENRS